MSVYLQWTDAAGNVKFFSFDSLQSEEPEFTLTITEHPVEGGSDIADHAKLNNAKLRLVGFVTETPNNDGGGYGSDYILQQKFTGDVLPEFRSVDFADKIPPMNGGPFILSPGGLTKAVQGGISSLATAVGLKEGPQTKATLLSYANYKSRVAAVQNLLKEAQEKKYLVEVFGGLRDLQSMLLESVVPTRSVDDGDGATFTINLKQVRFVATETVQAARPSELRGLPPVSKGSGNAKPAKKPEDLKEKSGSFDKTIAASLFDGAAGSLGF